VLITNWRQRSTFVLLMLLTGVICLLQTGMVLADDSISIVQGVVIVASSGMPIEKAVVSIGSATTLTDVQGTFVIKGISAGRHTVSIKASGYESRTLEVSVVPGTNKLSTLTLKPESVQLADVNVSATSSMAQIAFEDKLSTEVVTDTASAAALNNANNTSGADIVKDVSGVSVSKGAGGTSTVSVRGIDQRMLRITVDGQRQGGAGNPLDTIPAEIVQSLEVTKTFTPDMDADAVGGVININTGGVIIKDAYIQGRHQVTHNVLAPRPALRNSITMAQPFSIFEKEHNASVMITGSFDDVYARRERLSNLREWTAQPSPGPAPYTNSLVPVLTLPLIESSNEHRQRGGLVMNGDARFGDLAVYLRSNLNRDWTHRDRRINDTNPAMGTPQTLTPTSATFSGVPLSRRDLDQTNVREAGNFSVGAKSKFNGNEWDVAAAYTLTREDEPHSYETGFKSDDEFAVHYDLSDPYRPRFSYLDETTVGDATAARDPSRYHMNYFSLTDATLHEEDASLKFNLKLNWDTGNYLKFGGKVERRHRRAGIDKDYYNAGSQPLSMSQVLNASQLGLRTAPYDIGPVPSARMINGMLATNAAAFLLDPVNTSINSNTGDYAVTENMWALYAMGKYRLSRDWTLIGGVRVEGTQVDSSATQMQLDNVGALQGFDLANVTNSYTELLPSLHLRYDASPALVYRASITRSMSRPSNADIAPYRTLSFVDHRSRVGAPDLKPYLATNLDFSVDHYDAKYGLLSLALFYKKIDHFITDAQYPVTIGNLGEFIEFKRVNGDTALATGLELNWQGPQWNLPFKLGRGSLEANYSFNHGEAHHATRPGETFPLPRQVDHQGSVKFHEQRGALSIDASVNYRTGWWEDLIARDFDNYINAAWEAEISGSYKFSKTTRMTAGVSNLLDRPTRHYAGIESRMNDWQRNGREFTLGLQWKM